MERPVGKSVPRLQNAFNVLRPRSSQTPAKRSRDLSGLRGPRKPRKSPQCPPARRRSRRKASGTATITPATNPGSGSAIMPRSPTDPTSEGRNSRATMRRRKATRFLGVRWLLRSEMLSVQAARRTLPRKDSHAWLARSKDRRPGSRKDDVYHHEVWRVLGGW